MRKIQQVSNMKQMRRLTCQVLAACAVTSTVLLANGGNVFAETSSGHTVTMDDSSGEPTGRYNNPVYGGEVDISTGEGQATNNTANIICKDSTTVEFTNRIAGGNVEIHGLSTANMAIANGNKLTLEKGKFAGPISGGYVDTKGGMAQADNNTLRIDGSAFESFNNCDIAGGWARSIEGPSCVAQANGNTVEVKNINIAIKWNEKDWLLSRSIYGGYATSYTGGTATANNNSLTISGASTSIGLMPHATNVATGKGYSPSVIYAGFALNGSTNTANNNTLIIDINTGKIDGYNDHGVDENSTEIGGGFANEAVAGNKVIIHSGTIGSTGKEINVYGGKAHELVKGNEVILDGGATITGNVSGGYGEGLAPTVEGNRVVFSAGTVNGMVSGGSGVGAALKGNEVIVPSGTVTAKEGIYGARARGQYTKAEGNKSVITGGATVTGDVHGGYVDEEYNTFAQNNTVVVADGIVKGNVFGGGTWWTDDMEGSAQNVINNTVILGEANGTGTATVTKNVYINYHKWDDDITADGALEALPGGNLTVYNTGNKVEGNVNAPGANVDFHIKDSDLNQTTPMLNVGGTADFSNAKVVAHVRNLGPLDGSRINLIGAGTLTNTGATYTLTDGLLDNSSLVADGDSIKGTVDGRKTTVNENAKSPSETQVVGVALVNGALDAIAGDGFGEAAKAIKGGAAGEREMLPFATMGGSVMHQDSGSYVDMKSWNIGVGFAKAVENKNGKLIFGPIFNYGRGSYDSYLDNGTYGYGNSSFYGLGGMVKQENNNGVYYEGSLMLGRLQNDYYSKIGYGMSYDNSANFYAMHAGVGKVRHLQDDIKLDYYGKLFYTHQNGSSASLSSGHVYDFHAVSSIRSRLGVRYTHQLPGGREFYAGIAWQHEFDSKVKATLHSGAFSFTAPAPSVRGETGIFELGWKVKPVKGNIETNLGLVGSIGKQKGLGFNAQVQWNF